MEALVFSVFLGVEASWGNFSQVRFASMHACKKKQASKEASQQASKPTSQQAASEQASKKGKKKTASQQDQASMSSVPKGTLFYTVVSAICEVHDQKTLLLSFVSAQFCLWHSSFNKPPGYEWLLPFFVSIELGVVNFKTRAGVQSIDSYVHRQTTNSCPDHNTLGIATGIA